MKHLLTTAIVALSATLAIGAPSGEDTRARRVPTVTGDGTTIYGEVTHSNSMDITSADGLAWGLYSFNASSPMTVSPLSIHNTLCANGGGTYRKGKLYFTSYYEDMTGALGYLYFIEMDLTDYSIERHALRPDSYQAIAADMTYDPVGDKIYGVSFNPDDLTLTSYILVDYDIETGYPVTIGSIARMSALACDNMGQLWGVRYSDGKLVKINKMNAEVTEVGATGVNPIYNGTACFDFETGKLYWSTNERGTQLSGLYQIDTTTGAASLISLYPDNESMSSLYIPRADNITLLKPVTGLKAEFEGASLEGNITFTAPSTAIDGTPLSGDVTVTGYIDGTLNFALPMAPGATTSRQFSLEQGSHYAELVATHPSVGKSERVRLDFYVGADGPAAVSDLRVEKISDSRVKLTWQAPTEGEHGGSINPALTYYRIVRQPDNRVLTEEETGTSYTDNVPADLMRRYWYEITACYRNIEGATAQTEEIEMGQPTPIPYLQTFDTMNDYKTFVVRDNNKDKSRPDEGIWGWYEEKKCAAYKYHTLLPGDDWLITPGFKLEAGRTYRLRFKAQGGRIYPETLEVKIGKGYSPESFTKTLMPRTDIVSPNQQFEEREIVFDVPESGNYYIGFHAVTQKGQFWLWLDDVAVEDGVSMSAPGAVTDLQVTPGEVPSEVNIRFNAPSTDLFNKTLTDLTEIKVTRGDVTVKTLTASDNLAPGKEFSFTDTGVPAGMTTYTLLCSNSHGAGNPVTAEIYAGLDIPVAVTEVTHTTGDGIKARITWKASEAGVNGGRISYEPVTYRITDNSGRVVADGVSGTEFTDDKIDNIDGQRNMFYIVQATNSAGISDGSVSGFITYGKAYQNEFAESFAGGKGTSTRDWMISLINPSPYDNGFYGRYFSFRHNPNDKDRGPKPEPQDKDGGMLVAYTDYINVEARMISPKINVSGLKNPVLSFWFYHYYNPDTENGFSTENETMTVETYIDGEFKALTEKPILLINGNGWYRYDLSLKEAVGSKDFQIAFRTHNYISYDMHVDNITVHDTPDNDLMLESFRLPSMIAVNSTRNAEVTVFNNGILPTDDFSIELYRDGEKVASMEPSSELAFAKSMTFMFPLTPAITEAGKNYSYQAKIVFGADANASNNVSEAIAVQIPGNDLPKVTDLKGNMSDGKVLLTWSEPDMTKGGTVTDGFESYEAFTITNFGSWSLFDGDGSLTYTISSSDSETGDYQYPNAGYQMAFQVFNPSAINMKGDLWTPYLGNQMAVCFAAAERNNDDWLISPEVKGGSTVTFMARSVVDYYGLDKFFFCYSSGDEVKIADFKPIGKVNVVPASEWTRYEFTLPEDARYFAINCVSEITYALLIDEVTYESASADVLEFRGYNIYRDGTKINAGIVEENEYIDSDPKSASEGPSLYNVTAIFDKGESCLSNDALVDYSSVEGIAGDLMRINVTEGAIEVLYAGCEVTVCDINGIVIFNGEAGDYVRVAVQPGIYMVKAGNRVLKAIVR